MYVFMDASTNVAAIVFNSPSGVEAITSESMQGELELMRELPFMTNMPVRDHASALPTKYQSCT